MFEKLNNKERRIVELVARGRTNHEVGERLKVSHKTAEWTLTRFYKKLQVRGSWPRSSPGGPRDHPGLIPGVPPDTMVDHRDRHITRGGSR